MLKIKKRIKNKIRFPKKEPRPDHKLYQVNKNLSFFEELRSLILRISPPSFPSLERSLRKIGRFKLAVVTGVFLNLSNTRVDLLVVGDDIDYRRFSDFIKNLENNMGVELRYVVLGLNEFLYRYGMFDRFVRDILEYPHKKLINRLKILK